MPRNPISIPETADLRHAASRAETAANPATPKPVPAKPFGNPPFNTVYRVEL
jgi:hypothetical protein